VARGRIFFFHPPAHPHCDENHLERQSVKVKVTYLSVVRDAVGMDEETLDIEEGSTVGELLSSIMAKHGERMKQVLDPSSDMGQSIMVTLNGELLSPSDMDKAVSADAELLVGIPPFGG